MGFELGLLLAPFGGGLFGATIRALPTFVLTGIAVLATLSARLGGASIDVLSLIVFGAGGYALHVLLMNLLSPTEPPSVLPISMSWPW